MRSAHDVGTFICLSCFSEESGLICNRLSAATSCGCRLVSVHPDSTTNKRLNM
ncbi:MAG: hypothetical protein IIT76_15565 [Prevotella sp.]|nr:hypothetical protein [Prevotella sp.]